MPRYRPTELRELLAGFPPLKALSQNFLIDHNILEKIAKSALITPGETILEIGPGPGALTEMLLSKGADVIAIEKDERFIPLLRLLDPDEHHLKILCSDFFDVELEKLNLGKPIKVVANLPYNITSPILTYLVTKRKWFTHLVVMIQEEVARRITASAGSKTYGSLSLFLQLFADVKYAFSVSRHCFYPAPKVDSAVVTFTLKTPPMLALSPDFERFFRRAFGQRRKQLRTTLGQHYPEMDFGSALRELGKSETARPEELTPQEFINLYESVEKTRREEPHQTIEES